MIELAKPCYADLLQAIPSRIRTRLSYPVARNRLLRTLYDLRRHGIVRAIPLPRTKLKAYRLTKHGHAIAAALQGNSEPFVSNAF